MKRIFLFLVTVLCSTILLQSQETKPTLAVLDVASVNVQETQSSIVQNYILDQVHNFGSYTVVERSELESAFAEMELSLSGSVDEATAVKIGKIAGAEYILLSSLARSEGRYHISMRIVSVATSQIIKTSARSAASFARIEKHVKEAVTQLLGSGLEKKPVTGFGSLNLSFDLGFPLGAAASILTLACIPGLDAAYNFSFPWGIFSAGLSITPVITATQGDTLAAYNLFSVPVGAVLGYTTAFASPFFMSLRAGGGAACTFLVYPASETGTVPKTFITASFAVLAEIRAGFDLNDVFSVYARGTFTCIQFSTDDYMAVSPGLGAAVKL